MTTWILKKKNSKCTTNVYMDAIKGILQAKEKEKKKPEWVQGIYYEQFRIKKWLMSWNHKRISTKARVCASG
jgi:hypothetical protein